MAGANAIHTTKHPKKLTTIEQNQQDPSKFYFHFLYKASIVLIFFVILPLFPSQAPEFINQSLLTRNWELLHLVFVGIAISYGLFSRRNNETEKENNSKFDSAQSLVSRFLQVSSFFEDEAESENPSQSDEIETKVQTWSNQHYRNEPVVVVAPQAQQDSDFEDSGARSGEKPLLLPVRSLKSRLADDDVVVDGSYKIPFTGSKSFSNRARNAEVEGPGSPKLEDKMKEKENNVVLPSPIPWRSRSARMEHKKEFETPTSKEESEFCNKVELEAKPVKSQTLRSSRTSSMSPSPKLSPLSSFSSESLAKNTEDLLRKKGFYKSCCPPPPPPPPPMVFQKSISMKPRHEGASFDKELKRSFTSGDRKWSRSFEEEEHSMQEPTRKKNMGYGEGTSFRTDKNKFIGHASVPLVSEPMEFVEEEKESFLDKVIVESEDDDTETEDDDVGEGRVIEKETHVEESSKIDEPSSSNIGDEGPDVDKKADEFIAKFREQIRLQRIESIKRSTRIPKNSSR